MSKNCKYIKSIKESVNIKGVLSDDLDTIVVKDRDNEIEISLKDYLKKFEGKIISVSVKTQSDKDLDEIE